MSYRASHVRGSPSSPQLWLGSFAFVTVFMVVLCVFFEPRWETNDDVAMSMVAGGYGLAATGTPNLVFSNTVWGYLVRLIPQIGGTSGYSIATIGVLVAVGTVITHGLVRLGLGYLGTISVVALILARPIVLPQFTINAGLLMVGAVMCWQLYARHDDRRALLTGCLFAFLSYLVRSLEFVLVLAVALPVLPWQELLTRRAARFAAVALAVAIAISAVIDHRAYQGPEWTTFKELDSARTPYTDFRADARLKQRPDILDRHQYSINDVDLIGNWFYVDQGLANPTTLKAMLNELGPLPAKEFALIHVRAGMQIFWHSVLTPIFLAACLLALLRPSWKTATIWILCIGAVLVMGVAGRPGVARVCMPLACLLLIAPFFSRQPVTGARSEQWRYALAVVVMLVAAVFNASLVFSDSRSLHGVDASKRVGIAGFPTDPVIVWGGAFPFQAVYPVLGPPLHVGRLQLYGLGVLTWAPFTVSYSEHGAGRGLTARLVEDQGVPIVGGEHHFVYLDNYCKEHLRGKLHVISVQPFGVRNIRTVRCVQAG